MRHAPALVTALALAVPAVWLAPDHGHGAGLALFSFAVSAIRTRIG